MGIQEIEKWCEKCEKFIRGVPSVDTPYRCLVRCPDCGDLCSERSVDCPYCKEKFPENCEYCDIGVGNVQMSPNHCPSCGAYEIGCISFPDLDDEENSTGWRKGRRFLVESPLGNVSLSESAVRMYASVADFAAGASHEAKVLSTEECVRLHEGMKDLLYVMGKNKVALDETGNVAMCLRALGQAASGLVSVRWDRA